MVNRQRHQPRAGWAGAISGRSGRLKAPRAVERRQKECHSGSVAETDRHQVQHRDPEQGFSFNQWVDGMPPVSPVRLIGAMGLVRPWQTLPVAGVWMASAPDDGVRTALNYHHGRPEEPCFPSPLVYRLTLSSF